MAETRTRLDNARVGRWETAEEAAARMAALARLRTDASAEPWRRTG
jgi:hypothetical protein